MNKNRIAVLVLGAAIFSGFFATSAHADIAAPFATTYDASNISETSATLNGFAGQNANQSVTAWFEYATSPSLSGSHQTPIQTIEYPASIGSYFSESLNGLSPNTTYYFRAVSGTLYLKSYGTVKSFTTPGNTNPPPPPPPPYGSAPEVSTNSASNVNQNSARLNGFADPNGSYTTAWFEYGPTQSLGTSVGSQGIGSSNSGTTYSATVFNLAPNTTYYFRAVAQNTYGTVYGSILSFTTNYGGGGGGQGSAPSANTLSAFSISQNSATLAGSVNPNGLSTDIYFEYGTSYSLGNTTNNQQIGSGTNSVSVNEQVFGLSSYTTYYYRVVARNSAGTTYGAIYSFSTLQNQYPGGGQNGYAPSVTTQSASGISTMNATLHGNANPNNSYTTVWFEYGTSYSLGLSSGSQGLGSGTNSNNFSSSIYGLSPYTTYYYRAVAQNTYGTRYGDIYSFTTSQGGYGGGGYGYGSVYTYQATSISQNSATLQGAVSGNGYSTSAYFEWGTTQYFGNTTGSQLVGTNYGNSNFSSTIYGLSPNTTYYFRAVAQFGGGTQYGSVLSFTTNSGGYYGGTNIPFVSTNGASYVETTSAQMNSTVDPRGAVTTGWFEWGTSIALGNVTGSRDLGFGFGTVQFSLPLNSLSPNTTYYYRAVARNAFGTVQGSIVSFVTKPLFTTPPVTPPVTPPPAAPVLTPSLIIEPSVDNPEPNPGQNIEYRLRYRNESASNSVSRISVRIMLPDNVTFVSGSVAPTLIQGNELQFSLGSLGAGGSGELQLKLAVSSDAKDGDNLVLGAIANYRDASNRAQSTSAYLTITVTSGFLAALFGMDIHLGWLLLILLLIIIIFLIMRRLGNGGSSHGEPSHGTGFSFRRSTHGAGH